MGGGTERKRATARDERRRKKARCEQSDTHTTLCEDDDEGLSCVLGRVCGTAFFSFCLSADQVQTGKNLSQHVATLQDTVRRQEQQHAAENKQSAAQRAALVEELGGRDKALDELAQTLRGLTSQFVAASETRAEREALQAKLAKEEVPLRAKAADFHRRQKEMQAVCDALQV